MGRLTLAMVGLACCAVAASQRSAPEAPPLSYVCPMAKDAEVVEDKPGACVKCGMALVPVRLAATWSCPIHQAYITDKPGRCPYDKRPLTPITAAMYFTCKGDPSVKALTLGTCADGTAQTTAFERRPHGDHNPRHGGQFFMADDNWHHLEGTYAGDGLLRFYFYNDYTQPIAAQGMAGRVTIVNESGREISSAPLKASTVRNALDARVRGAALPLRVRLSVAFTPADAVRSFDFMFVKPEAQRAAVATPASSPRPDTATAAGLLAELETRRSDVASLLDEGRLGAIWLPAIAAKDASLALEDAYAARLPASQRVAASSAVKRLVLTAWQLDTLGDLGDRQKVTDVYTQFAAAAADIQAAYASVH